MKNLICWVSLRKEGVAEYLLLRIEGEVLVLFLNSLTKTLSKPFVVLPSLLQGPGRKSEYYLNWLSNFQDVLSEKRYVFLEADINLYHIE